MAGARSSDRSTWSPGSFDGRRELAIETSNRITVARLKKYAHADWHASRRLDLSDAGLLHDLAKRAGHDPQKLAVEGE